MGDSGSGKSSALRAGLLPALAAGVLPGSDHWPQVVIRPGEAPMAEVARGLARAFPDGGLPAADAPAALDGALARLGAGHRILLVVDQFEEIFNATRDEAERSAFVDLLTAERPGLKVIVAMRADHYGRCAAYPALARLLGSEQVLVGPLSATELAAVIEHPAQRVGLRVEPALTEAIVADAGREPGVLPLLSTTLLELWGLRDGGRLTLASYRATGGLHGAIARLAEATFAELDPHRRRVARSLLLRLAGPGEGTALVRRSVALDELDAAATRPWPTCWSGSRRPASSRPGTATWRWPTRPSSASGRACRAGSTRTRPAGWCGSTSSTPSATGRRGVAMPATCTGGLVSQPPWSGQPTATWS